MFALLVVLLVLSHASAAKGSMPPNGKRANVNPKTGAPIVRLGSIVWTQEQIRELVQRKGFRDVEKAVAIAWRESQHGHVEAVVDTRGMSKDELHAYWGAPALEELSVGLWQLNAWAHRDPMTNAIPEEWNPERLKDPEYNADRALALSRQGTWWGPWGG